MIPTPINHGMHPAFLCALQDHMMQWDPVSRSAGNKVCCEIFKLTFDQMLALNPQFITEHTPCHVPSPSILVPAIEYVYKTFGNALDAKTNEPLFNKQAWAKANAVLELAHQGYLSDIDGIPMYKRAGIDKYGLQKWKCLQGTNNVEGSPHGDIYRKFGAFKGISFLLFVILNSSDYFPIAGPHLATNCLTDHCAWYNLQVS